MDLCTYICITTTYIFICYILYLYLACKKTLEDKVSHQLGVIPGDHIRIKGNLYKDLTYPRDKKETNLKKSISRAGQAAWETVETHKRQDAQPPSISSYINSNHMDTVLPLHENGKNPERTVTYSAGEALLSCH